MTNEAQRIALAEAYGWERWKSKSGKVVLLIPKNETQRAYWLECGDSRTTEPVNWWNTTQHVPDYLNDLNAVHEAEKTLPEGLKIDYINRLYEVTHRRERTSKASLDRDYGIVFATAAQRVEAMLKTLNLWKE